MGFRFQRRITILPGVRLNLSKSGVSLSLGPRGASVSIGKRGVFGNVGIPGTGLSHRTRLAQPPSRPAARTQDPAGFAARPASDTDALSGAPRVLDEEQYVVRLARLLHDREQGNIDWQDRAIQALHAPPEDDEAFEIHARAHAQARFARRMVNGDRAAWSEVLHTELSNEDLPFGFSFDFSVDEETDLVEIGVELPDPEVVPSRASRQLKNGGVAYRQLPKGIVRAFYEDVCCALVLRVTHEAYRVLPEADSVHVTGFRPERDPRTGEERRAILLRFATDRRNFSVLDLDHVDPSDAFEHLGGASAKTRGLLTPVAYAAS